MFREMVRKKQQLTQEECVRILTEEKRGVLSVLGDGGYPYGIPLNHYYCPEDGRLYFHSGPTGHKIDAIRRENRASFCVSDAGYRKEGDWALNVKSVIVFGRVEMVRDPETVFAMARALSRKFTSDEAYIEHEIAHAGPHTLMFALVPEWMSGKLVNES